MIPHNRELVQRLTGKPFTILGINSDQNRSVLKKTIDEQKINYPNIFDGDRGPIAANWNVSSFPTIYILDHEGIIRHKDLRDQKLEAAVLELLKKAPGAGG